jgi:hypothetical protein
MDYNNNQEDSWSKMMRRSLLAGVSEKNPFALTSGPLGQSDVSGISLLAKRTLDQQCGSILSVADEIWLAIIKIQDLMEIRNNINENCMQSEEEANRLLKATNSVQQLIEHISAQEDTYITLSDSINRNTIQIVQSYLALMKKSSTIATTIADEVSTEMKLSVKPQNQGVEKSLLSATSIQDLVKFSIENTLEIHTGCNPVELAQGKLNHQCYDDYIVIQAFLLICYRFAMSQALGTNNTFNASGVLKACIAKKVSATSILNESDVEQTFNLHEFSKQNTLSDQLQHALTVNPDFLRKLESTLSDLKELSDSRKPDDDQQNEEAA